MSPICDEGATAASLLMMNLALLLRSPEARERMLERIAESLPREACEQFAEAMLVMADAN